MSEETEDNSVINLEQIMQPVSEENPSGESLRYSGVYDEIREAGRADDDVPQGDWQIELKVADFSKVIELAVPALENETKDLQIAAWLSEALVKQHGFLGLRDSLKMMSGLQENFWETVFPEIDEGDMEGRANALAWMDAQTAFAAKEAAITQGEGFGLLGYLDSKTFDIPDNLDTLDSADQEKYRELAEKAEKENRATAERWRKAVSVSKRAFYEELDQLIEECWESYNALNLVIEEKFDPNQAPRLGELKKSLDEIQTQTNKLLEQKRQEEPGEVEETVETIENEDGETVVVQTSGGFSASGAIGNRREALKRLGEVADFFRKSEPHSPVSYLVNRAVKWGNMPLESWLQDVIKDETILGQLRETLGINGAAGDTVYTEESAESSSENSEDSWS